MRRAVLLAVSCALGTARTAYASPSARLLYARSPDAATCPDEAALRKAVAARFGYDPFFPWATRAVIVQVWRAPHGYAARVQAVDEQGMSQGTRELSSDGESCAELFDAAALAISIALDATAAVEAPSPAPSAPPPPDPTPPTAVTPLAMAPAEEEPPAAPAKRDVPESRNARPSKYWTVGADAMGGVGVAPGANAGIEAFVGRRVRALSLEVGLRADMSFPTTLVSSNGGDLGRAQSARFAVVVAPCAHLWVAYGCPLAELGWIQAWGSGLAHAQSPGGTFVAAGARIGVDVPLGPSVDLRIYADGIADLDRPMFQIDGVAAWQAPLLAGAVGVGLGSVIP